MSLSFATPARRPRAESIVPMINVVFLLLIFFLMTSRLAPPDPFEVTPPNAGDGQPGEASAVLYLSAEGEVAFEDLRGEAAVAGFAARNAEGSGTMVPRLRADAQVEAAAVARLMRDLAAAGLSNVALVVGAE